MPTESELGWLAGILDGEGCIYLQIPPPPNRHVCKVSIVNTDNGILSEVRRLLTELSIFYTERVKPSNDFTRHPAITIECNRQLEMYAFLSILLPYLKGAKKDKAANLISYIYTRRNTKRPDGRKRNLREKR